MAVYTFPPNKPFISHLAEHIIASDMRPSLVLLPSKRSCNALTDYITAAGAPVPMIIALGEFADHPHTQSVLKKLGRDDLTTPAISSMKRQLMLAKLCVAASQQRDNYRLNMSQALELAGSLASLLDEFQRQEVPLSEVQQLAPEEYAIHWQRILEFLNIITVQWPRILAGEVLMDPITRRNEIYAQMVTHWQDKQHEKIIIAGSTGSNKAVAKMMTYLATQSHGEVILPALPQACDAAYWQAISPSHPYFYAKQFLDSLDQKSDDVEVLNYKTAPTSCAARHDLFHQAFLPAALSYQWMNAPTLDEKALENIEFVEADNDLAQARQIALMCKNLVAKKDTTNICIVSERPAFTKLLSTTFQSAGLHHDSSEGQSLNQNPWAIWLMLILETARAPMHPAHMLALLKHPMFQDEDCNQQQLAQWLEQYMLRRSGPYHTMEHLVNVLQASEEPVALEVVGMLDSYSKTIQPFSTLLRAQAPFGVLLKEHVACLELLSSNDLHADKKTILLEFLEQLAGQASYLENVDADNYQQILHNLFGRQTMPLATEAHSNIRILPSEEARLETADTVIITDFNEGTWPARASINPWISRAMQTRLGFDLDHMQASRMAHDFMMLSHVHHLIILRPLMSDQQTTTIPSPWWQRIRFYLQACGTITAPSELTTNQYEQQLNALVYAGNTEPSAQPAPTPPASVRPNHLSISDLELLQRDPYSIYAKHILRLKPLDALMNDNTQALYGQVLHRILELFCRQYPQELPTYEDVEFEPLIMDTLHSYQVDRHLHALWVPKLQASLAHYYQLECERRPMIKKVGAEIKLSATMDVHGKQWTLYGRADRIEYYQDGTAAIIDYKTGSTPLVRDVKNYIACQLPAGAWIFTKQYDVHIDSVEYWQLSSNAATVKPMLSKVQEKQTIAEIGWHLHDLLAHYDLADTPYTATPDAAIAPNFADYNQLARYAEWS